MQLYRKSLRALWLDGVFPLETKFESVNCLFDYFPGLQEVYWGAGRAVKDLQLAATHSSAKLDVSCVFGNLNRRLLDVLGLRTLFDDPRSKKTVKELRYVRLDHDNAVNDHGSITISNPVANAPDLSHRLSAGSHTCPRIGLGINMYTEDWEDSIDDLVESELIGYVDGSRDFYARLRLRSASISYAQSCFTPGLVIAARHDGVHADGGRRKWKRIRKV